MVSEFFWLSDIKIVSISVHFRSCSLPEKVSLLLHFTYGLLLDRIICAHNAHPGLSISIILNSEVQKVEILMTR